MADNEIETGSGHRRRGASPEQYEYVEEVVEYRDTRLVRILMAVVLVLLALLLAYLGYQVYRAQQGEGGARGGSGSKGMVWVESIYGWGDDRGPATHRAEHRRHRCGRPDLDELEQPCCGRVQSRRHVRPHSPGSALAASFRHRRGDADRRARTAAPAVTTVFSLAADS